MPIKLAIVEDDRRFLESLRLLIMDTPSIEIVGTYSTGNHAIRGIIDKCPDVALIDLGLPDIPGVEVIKRISEKCSGTELLVLTVYNDDRHLFAALRAGAVGYIVKDEATHSEIVKAINEAVKGGAPMSMEIARRMLTEFQKQPERLPDPAINQLTKREIEVLEYLSRGYTARKTADALFISYETVRSHQKNIYRKLQVNSLVEAVVLLRR